MSKLTEQAFFRAFLALSFYVSLLYSGRCRAFSQLLFLISSHNKANKPPPAAGGIRYREEGVYPSSLLFFLLRNKISLGVISLYLPYTPSTLLFSKAYSTGRLILYLRTSLIYCLYNLMVFILCFICGIKSV